MSKEKQFYEVDLPNGSRANLLKVFAPIVLASSLVTWFAFEAHDIMEDARVKYEETLLDN